MHQRSRVILKFLVVFHQGRWYRFVGVYRVVFPYATYLHFRAEKETSVFPSPLVTCALELCIACIYDSCMHLQHYENASSIAQDIIHIYVQTQHLQFSNIKSIPLFISPKQSWIEIVIRLFQLLTSLKLLSHFYCHTWRRKDITLAILPWRVVNIKSTSTL